jgi:hypothetical protein
VRRAALVAVALALAGCGGGGRGGSAASNPCGEFPGFRPLRNEIPRGIAPGGTLVANVRHSGKTVSGDLLFSQGVADTYLTLSAATTSHGYIPARLDNEGFEAEVEVTRGAEQLLVKITQIQGCSSAAGGRFTRVRASAATG